MKTRHKTWLNGSALALIATLAAGSALAQESGGTGRAEASPAARAWTPTMSW